MHGVTAHVRSMPARKSGNVTSRREKCRWVGLERASGASHKDVLLSKDFVSPIAAGLWILAGVFPGRL